MNTTLIIEKDNAAVVITAQLEDDGELKVWANLWVNTRGQIKNNCLYDGDITLRRWEGKTVKGAKNWANKVLEIKP